MSRTLTILFCVLFVGQVHAAISESEYHRVIDSVETAYRPVIEGLGEKLIIHRKWEYNLTNAFAERYGYTKEWVVTYYGGLAQFEAMNADAFTIVVCHEFGHHLGGAPFYKESGMRWAAVEGQADHWASQECLKKVWEHDDNERIIQSMKVPTLITERCSQKWSDPHEKSLCIRTIMAGLVFGKIFNDSGVNPSFEKPDPTIVTKTLEKHASGQCRLDTLAHAALCSATSCEQRPACWYKKP
jgi:hypothetical protein